MYSPRTVRGRRRVPIEVKYSRRWPRSKSATARVSFRWESNCGVVNLSSAMGFDNLPEDKWIIPNHPPALPQHSPKEKPRIAPGLCPMMGISVILEPPAELGADLLLGPARAGDRECGADAEIDLIADNQAQPRPHAHHGRGGGDGERPAGGGIEELSLGKVADENKGLELEGHLRQLAVEQQ